MNVSLRIIDDHIFEPTETLTLRIVIPEVIKDNILINEGPNNIAKGEIINSGKAYTNFTPIEVYFNKSIHTVNESDQMILIDVMTSSRNFSDEFSVEIKPFVNTTLTPHYGNLIVTHNIKCYVLLQILHLPYCHYPCSLLF